MLRLSHPSILSIHQSILFCKLQMPKHCCCSVTQSCLTLCDPMDCSMPGSLSITNSQSLLKLMSIESVMPSNHLVFCHPLLLLPSIFPSIRVFSNESVLHIRWPKYWSSSFRSHFAFIHHVSLASSKLGQFLSCSVSFDSGISEESCLVILVIENVPQFWFI